MTEKGFKIEAGALEIWNGARKVFTTDGTLILLLPTEHSFLGQTLSFSDGVKDWCYGWRGKDDRGFNPSPDEPDSHNQNNIGQVFFSRLPGDTESSVNLMAAPPGANMFAGRVKLTRTTAPTHTWWKSSGTLAPLVPTGKWIPWNGSGMIESAVGLTRLMHLVVEGGQLKLVAEQSIGPATGGQVRTWGDYPASAIFTTVGDNEGGSFEVKTTPGMIVWTSTSSPYRKSSSRIINTDLNPADFTTHQRTGGDPASTTDPTNYTSVYSVDVVGQFGKRS